MRPALGADGADGVKRFDLGQHGKTISTTSPKAQELFNIGLNWCYGFNQEEGVKCFLAALKHDPECVMAHWGVAYGAGPFYNNTWRQHSNDEAGETTRLCHSHIQRARAHADTYEALEVIERSIALRDAAGQTRHPAILHLHIHLTEMSNEPERAMRSADICAKACGATTIWNTLNPGPERHPATLRAASRQRLGTARAGRMPDPARRR